MRLKYLIILLALLFCKPAYSQSYNDVVPGTIIVSSIMSITVTNLTGTTNFTTSNDYANGKTISNYAAVAIKSNVLWVLSISSQSANFSPQSTGASTNMPASILGMRVNGTSNFLTMSTSSQTLKTGGRGNASYPGNSFNMDADFDPGYGYNGGVYTIGVLYTLSKQ